MSGFVSLQWIQWILKNCSLTFLNCLTLKSMQLNGHAVCCMTFLRLAPLWQPVPWNLQMMWFNMCSLWKFGLFFVKYLVEVVYWSSVFAFPGPWNSKALDQCLDFQGLGNFLHHDFSLTCSWAVGQRCAKDAWLCLARLSPQHCCLFMFLTMQAFTTSDWSACEGGRLRPFSQNQDSSLCSYGCNSQNSMPNSNMQLNNSFYQHSFCQHCCHILFAALVWAGHFHFKSQPCSPDARSITWRFTHLHLARTSLLQGKKRAPNAIKMVFELLGLRAWKSDTRKFNYIPPEMHVWGALF